MGSSTQGEGESFAIHLKICTPGLALIFRPCLPRHGQTPARRLRSAGKRTALARRTRLRRPPLICRRRGDEAHFKSGCWVFKLEPPHVGSYVMEDLRTGPSSPSAASQQGAGRRHGPPHLPRFLQRRAAQAAGRRTGPERTLVSHPSKTKMEALHLLKLKPKQNIGKWKAESPQNKPTLHGCHGVFSPRSRSLARRPLENPRVGICRTFIRKNKKRNYHFPAGIFNFSSSSPSRCRMVASTFGTYICVSAGRCAAMRS